MTTSPTPTPLTALLDQHPFTIDEAEHQARVTAWLVEHEQQHESDTLPTENDLDCSLAYVLGELKAERDALRAALVRIKAHSVSLLAASIDNPRCRFCQQRMALEHLEWCPMPIVDAALGSEPVGEAAR